MERGRGRTRCVLWGGIALGVGTVLYALCSPSSVGCSTNLVVLTHSQVTARGCAAYSVVAHLGVGLIVLGAVLLLGSFVLAVRQRRQAASAASTAAAQMLAEEPRRTSVGPAPATAPAAAASVPPAAPVRDSCVTVGRPAPEPVSAPGPAAPVPVPPASTRRPSSNRSSTAAAGNDVRRFVSVRSHRARTISARSDPSRFRPAGTAIRTIPVGRSSGGTGTASSTDPADRICSRQPTPLRRPGAHLRHGVRDQWAEPTTRTCPWQESNLRFRLRRPTLYPLSYRGRRGPAAAVWGRPSVPPRRQL